MSHSYEYNKPTISYYVDLKTYLKTSLKNENEQKDDKEIITFTMPNYHSLSHIKHNNTSNSMYHYSNTQKC
jgi:hypothetical protein